MNRNTVHDIIHEGNINLLDVLRHLAVSNKESYRDVIHHLSSSKLRASILEELDWLTPWVRLIAHEKSNVISVPRLKHLFDEAALALISTLQAHLESPPFGDETAMAMIDEFLIRSIREVELDAIDILLQAYEIPSSLPILEHLSDFLGVEPEPFKNTVVVASQHILGSNVALLHYLTLMGVSVENIYVLGKAYSTNFPTLLTLEKLGMHVSPHSVLLPPSSISFPHLYEEQRAMAAAEALEEVIGKLEKFKSAGTLLILDDGGTAIHTVMTSQQSSPSFAIAAVE
jgi:hypothetical protein